MNLETFLAGQGYRRIAVTRTGVGHFHAEGLLGDHPVSLLLDTGAASTIVGLDTAKALELPLTKMPFQGGGAGAARMDIYQIARTSLRLEDMGLRLQALLSMDLSHVNEALKLKGQEAVDVILGVDVFDAHSGVIDYGSRSLFLRP